jgi:hypothetical protein
MVILHGQGFRTIEIKLFLQPFLHIHKINFYNVFLMAQYQQKTRKWRFWVALASILILHFIAGNAYAFIGNKGQPLLIKNQ